MTEQNEIRERIEQVRENISLAAKKSGRSTDEITLVAVTKTVETPVILNALDCGITAVGENRVQELCRKYREITVPLEWHLIGHLQTNKVKQVVPCVNLIHSVDSIRLLDALEKECETIQKKMNVLLQVNVSGEESKFGITPQDAFSFAEYAAGKKFVRLCGLMTVPPPVTAPEENKPYFAALKELSFAISEKHYENVTMETLSMGMSGDYIAAIEEGSTIVRVGTSIFGKRNYAASVQ